MMEHPDHPGVTLDVGCVCAGWLEQDPDAARERETEFRLRQSRRERWPTRRGWRISKRGNSYIIHGGCNIVVWRVAEGWWLHRVTHRATGAEWTARHYANTEDAAKLAAFDHLPKHFPELRRRIAEAARPGADDA